MTQPFGQDYANAYDCLYRDKDYEAECDLVETVFREHASGPVRTVLDLGCGTGSHAIPLARRGYGVAGVDVAAGMLDQARAKAAAAGVGPEFHLADIRSVALGRRFDAVLMMFAVIGYQTENADVAAALAAARAHLEPGGVLMFDCWYGPAVLSQRPGSPTKVTEAGGLTLRRTTTTTVDSARNRCSVAFDLVTEKDGAQVSRSRETHGMRYFFIPELRLFLDHAGFEPVSFGVFPELGREPDEGSWNLLTVARAR